MNFFYANLMYENLMLDNHDNFWFHNW